MSASAEQMYVVAKLGENEQELSAVLCRPGREFTDDEEEMIALGSGAVGFIRKQLAEIADEASRERAWHAVMLAVIALQARRIVDLADAGETLDRAGRLTRGMLPAVAKQVALNEARKKSRRSQMPELDAWIAATLAANPEATNDELWDALPADSEQRFYRDGSKVYERGERITRASEHTSDRPIGRRAFDKRVTKHRKRR
jgi:hypothetical protein